MIDVVTLTSSDDQQFRVDIVIARMSETINRLIEACHNDEATEPVANIPIPLSNISSNTLTKIIEWCTEHKDDALDNADEEILGDIAEWDQAFLEIDSTALFDLIIAANYLEITTLLKMACKAVADMFKGKSPIDIRRTFGIINDLTEAAERVIEKETEWIDFVLPYTSSYEASKEASLLEILQMQLTCFAKTPALLHPFPLLDLPNEIISFILQQMHTVDRLRARVNRRLYLLEFLGKYRLTEMHIIGGEATPTDLSDPGKLTIGVQLIPALIETYKAVLQKFGRNVTVDSLTCEYPSRLYRDIFTYVKSISSSKLIINAHRMECVNDRSLDKWTRGREMFDLRAQQSAISGAGLCRLFHAMADKQTPLRRFHVISFGKSKGTMLRRLGLTFYNAYGRYTSTREDARLFVDFSIRLFFIVIGENMLITVGSDMRRKAGGDVWLERHNDDGSLPDEDYFRGARSIREIMRTCTPRPLVPP